MSFSDAPAIRFWNASEGVIGMRPPSLPKRRSRDSCTDSVIENFRYFYENTFSNFYITFYMSYLYMNFF